MPGGDHTGPQGLGPRTGRAAGFCAGYDVPGYANPGYGRGYGRMGWGRGRGGRGGGGRGWRHRFYATGLIGWQRGDRGLPPYPMGYDMPATPEQELSALQADLRNLEQSADQIRRRIEELESHAADKS